MQDMSKVQGSDSASSSVGYGRLQSFWKENLSVGGVSIVLEH
jgi:hypothetical protein